MLNKHWIIGAKTLWNVKQIKHCLSLQLRELASGLKKIQDLQERKSCWNGDFAVVHWIKALLNIRLLVIGLDFV